MDKLLDGYDGGPLLVLPNGGCCIQQLLSMEGPPSTLSSRAKPRDLQFSGPLVEMFFGGAQRSGGTCGEFFVGHASLGPSIESCCSFPRRL